MPHCIRPLAGVSLSLPLEASSAPFDSIRVDLPVYFKGPGSIITYVNYVLDESGHVLDEQDHIPDKSEHIPNESDHILVYLLGDKNSMAAEEHPLQSPAIPFNIPNLIFYHQN
jgi:hypothetical protein